MTSERIDRVGAQGVGQFPMTQTQYDQLVAEGKIAPATVPPRAPEDTPAPAQGAFNRAFGWLMRVVTRREYGQ